MIRCRALILRLTRRGSCHVARSAGDIWAKMKSVKTLRAATLNDSVTFHPLFAGAPQTPEFRNLRWLRVRDAAKACGRIARWPLCLSGGKGSYTLLANLHAQQWRDLWPVGL